MKTAAKKILSVVLALLMLIPTGIMSVFAQTEDASSADTETDVSYESTNAVGSMILDATQEKSGEESDYVIQSVDIEGKYAWVEFINLDACTLVVAVYDESGNTMLGSGKEEIEAKEAAANDYVTVTIEIDEMPEYFLVKAFMLDENNAPLCHNYETKEYTQAFEEFLAKTTDDFDEDMIINLDEADDNNFLVVSDDAIVIDEKDGVNTVTTDDYKNGLYVIENADSQITSLKPGDMIYYQYGDSEDEYILTTVGSIDVDGDTVTITAAESGELTDYFDYVKIDVEATQTTFDGSEMDEDVTHETVEITSRTRNNTNIDGTASVADKWTIDKTFDNAIKLSASIEFEASLSVKIYVDDALDYTYIEAVIKYSGKITASITGEVKIPPIPLGRIGFDTGKLGIVAAIKFDFVVEGEVEITLTYTLEEGAVGLAYSSDIGLIDKRQAPTTNFTPELKSELTIFIGVSITPEIQATKHIEISLEAKAGLEIKGTIFDTGSDELHSCSVCIDGEAAFKLEAIAAVRFFNLIENEWTLIEIEAKIGNFYFSFDIGFGFGKCPNINTDSGPDIDDTRPVTASGTCGDNLTWTLYEDGELVIDGTGAMYNYLYGAPWDSYCPDMKSVTIGNSVTKIGDSAFEDCESLTSVTMGNGVTYFGIYAFRNCTGLTNVTIGNSVKSISASAFQNCRSLTSITIPDSVNAISKGAFAGCYSLTSITIGNGVTIIDEFAFNLNSGNLPTVYYTGTEEQWSSISISSYSGLTYANIICSDTVLTASFMSFSLRNAPAAYSESTVISETVSNAVLGNSYVILVVKDKNAEDLLASENLIYIDQKIAESSTLTFDFDLNGETDYDVIITNEELNHSHKYTAVITAPTCTAQGYTTYTCYCGDTYTDPYVDALGHTEEIISGMPADCTNDGLTDGVICSVCQTELTAQQIILATGHINENDDNYCDSCGHDFSSDCSHICHSSSAFMRFFWKIALFFNKLFNIQSNHYCDCGVAHW